MSGCFFETRCIVINTVHTAAGITDDLHHSFSANEIYKNTKIKLIEPSFKTNTDEAHTCFCSKQTVLL